MFKERVVVHEGTSSEEARRAALLLVAMGLDAENRPARLPGLAATWQVSVPEDEVDAALGHLAEGIPMPEGAPPPPPPPGLLLGAGEGIWTWKNASGSLAIALACLAIHAVVHGGAEETTRSQMIEAGAVAPWLVREGQWWRLVSAAFLHFDLKHLVGNLSALVFLGPPLAASIGQLRLLLLFVVTAVAGNLVSQVLGDEAAVKAGASGGICGLLGALAGVALAVMASASDARERRPAWQTLGALVALFGMIVGFEPGRDHYAHLGGLATGVLLGRAFGVTAARGPAPAGPR